MLNVQICTSSRFVVYHCDAHCRRNHWHGKQVCILFVQVTHQYVFFNIVIVIMVKDA